MCRARGDIGCRESSLDKPSEPELDREADEVLVREFGDTNMIAMRKRMIAAADEHHRFLTHQLHLQFRWKSLGRGHERQVE